MDGKKVSWLLVATCFWWGSVARPSVIRNAVDDMNVSVYSEVKSTEVNSQISGPNGYCIDVKDGNFTDGTPIILWPCHSRPSANQLWTFKSGGTLQSNGKCLTSDGKTQGSKIMIYKCPVPDTYEVVRWQLSNNGLTIFNPVSGLFLTAISGTIRTQLTLQYGISSSIQTWRVSNNTKPSLVSITGFQGLCMQATYDDVWIEECDSSNVRQRWLLYPDATVRPEQNPEGCLSYDNLVRQKVTILFCGLGPSSQRWLFTYDGSILNQRIGLVMGVKGSDPSLKEIIMYSPTQQPNQKSKVVPLSSAHIS